ncbi:MAG: EAL domain-containing protein [Rhizobiales bacterium]|nr:EAL domain-containing protein [Hyphomicrobiales bacterium]
MTAVIGCMIYQHNPWLLLAAVVVCIISSWGVIRLFSRATTRKNIQKIVWHFLTAILAGSAIWSTHFIALIGFDSGVPFEFDPAFTTISLLVAMVGAACGFVIAASGWVRLAPLIGGGIVGLAVSAMHYAGMIAYRVQGIVSWNEGYVVASIACAVLFSAAAFHVAMRREASNYSEGWAAALQALGFAVAGVAVLIGCAGLAGYLIDEGVRAESYKQLQQMALHDSLTGLPNRRSFNERLDHEIEFAKMTGGKVALVEIDLDRFKEINDLRGHAAGDEVLRNIAERMMRALKESDFVARLGGDEFAAFHRTSTPADLIDFLSRIETVLSQVIKIDGYEFMPGASIGVAVYPDNAADKVTLVNNADLAMYRAKADVSQAICFYEPSMDEIVRARRSLANEMREAMLRDQLAVYYQVQTSVSTGEIVGYEALLRWEHPERGFIPPSEFIPIAEENGLIIQLGEWVLRTACRDAASWAPPYKVSVNVSPVQFAHVDLHKVIMEALLTSGLPADRLELELTETTIFANKERSLHILRQIKALGVKVALDDFGTGYSSLDTLRSFPFDKIKLDRSFIIEVESNLQAKAIIRAVLALGQSLAIPVLAEGIETEGQLELLKHEGCNEVQGYLLGRPAPLDRIVASGQLALCDKALQRDGMSSVQVNASRENEKVARFA